MTDITIAIKLRPFSTPDFAILEQLTKPRQDGWVPIESCSIPLAEVPPETLESLCDQFRSEVFRKAGYEP